MRQVTATRAEVRADWNRDKELRRLTDPEVSRIQRDAPRAQHFSISNFFHNCPLEPTKLEPFLVAFIAERNLDEITALLVWRGVQRMSEPLYGKDSTDDAQLPLL